MVQFIQAIAINVINLFLQDLQNHAEERISSGLESILLRWGFSLIDIHKFWQDVRYVHYSLNKVE